MKFFIIILSILTLFSIASAEIYKYTDDNGVTCYTDIPNGPKTVKVTLGRQSISIRPAGYVSGRIDDYSLFSNIIDDTARRYDMDPSLIHAVITAESNYNPSARSRKGAMGLMQLMPGTAVSMGVIDPYHPEQNIEGGTKYLRHLMDTFGDVDLALAAYNAGPEAVKRNRNSIPPYKETQQYVKKIKANYSGNTADSFDPAKPSAKKSSKAVAKVKQKDQAKKSVAKKAPSSQSIYKIVMDDGTMMFTNTPPTKTASAGF